GTGASDEIAPGGDLLSHAVTSAVPSALEGLTTVFGMGTGVAPPVWPPGTSATPPSEILETPARCATKPSAVKPHGRLVPVSSTPYGASTPGLSTWSSSRGLQRPFGLGGLISRRVLRLDCFSAFPSPPLLPRAAPAGPTAPPHVPPPPPSPPSA